MSIRGAWRRLVERLSPQIRVKRRRPSGRQLRLDSRKRKKQRPNWRNLGPRASPGRLYGFGGQSIRERDEMKVPRHLCRSNELYGSPCAQQRLVRGRAAENPSGNRLWWQAAQNKPKRFTEVVNRRLREEVKALHRNLISSYNPSRPTKVVGLSWRSPGDRRSRRVSRR